MNQPGPDQFAVILLKDDDSVSMTSIRFRRTFTSKDEAQFALVLEAKDASAKTRDRLRAVRFIKYDLRGPAFVREIFDSPIIGLLPNQIRLLADRLWDAQQEASRARARGCASGG